jgi:KaiC/GvpD/RAD55 family RecA-like ATPase
MMAWKPDLIGFDTLFADEKEAGFPSGSCILLAGPPGGGKRSRWLSPDR